MTTADPIIPSTEGQWLPTHWTMRRGDYVFEVEQKISAEGVVSYAWETWIEKPGALIQLGAGEEPLLAEAQIEAEDVVVETTETAT